MEENNQNLNEQIDTNNNVDEQVPKKKSNNSKILIILMALIIVGLVGYIGYLVYTRFIQKEDGLNNTNGQEEKVNINYDVLNYKCKEKICSDVDYANIKRLLKTNDTVKELYKNSDSKNHVVVLKSSSSGNNYIYLVNEDKYYFKDDNYYRIFFIDSYDSEKDMYIYDYNYAIVYQKYTKHYDNFNDETFKTKIYSFKDDKVALEFDDYIDSNNNISFVKYDNKHFYKIQNDDQYTLYDDDFNKIIAADDGFAFDNKYIFGEIEENDEYKFFKYNIADKKYSFSAVKNESDDLGVWTYNYIAKYNNGDYEIYDFDGNSIFKTDRKSLLKNIKAKDYILPEIPSLYYSKTDNRLLLILNPDICGDESCPPHFGYAYYEYNMNTKKLTYKFYSDNMPDDVFDYFFSGYAIL